MSEERKPLARSIGEFFGIIIKAAKEDVTKPAPSIAAPDKPVVIREEVEEKVVETEAGPLTLRRRVVDEVEGPGAKAIKPALKRPD